jgi:hypothetical protein
MGEHILAQADDCLETLIGFDASQAEGWTAFESQQVASMAEQLPDDSVGRSLV